MPSAADTHLDPAPRPRLGVDSKRMLARNLGLVLGLGAVAYACGLSLATSLLLASSTWLAMFVERLAVTREAGARMQVVSAAAQTEGQRDAIAQVMSLELAYERSRSVLEALREGVLVVDEVGEIVLANPAARRAMEMPERGPVGRVLWEALPAELAGRAREAFDALQERPRHQDELPQIRYSGVPCYDSVYDLTAVQAKSLRTGQDFGIVFLLVDTTRTHELQRIKDRFLSNVSHELRTPLTNICAFSEILCNMLPGESVEWPEFVRVIHEQGIELSELVDAMFDFLQLESGEAEFVNEPVDGVGSVQKVVGKRQSKADARGITLEVVVDEHTPTLHADRRRFEQVVRHLLDNAIKFSPENGHVRVTVTARDEGFELRIEDNGPGVAPEDRDAVFEKFNQLPDQMTEKPSGTGIGLATSRAIVARFGGLIWCEGSESGGACFVVLLPAKDQPRLAGFGAGLGAGGGF
ncbi:MAG: sensor histidine kinase [Planctomycetota bacterium]